MRKKTNEKKIWRLQASESCVHVRAGELKKREQKKERKKNYLKKKQHI